MGKDVRNKILKKLKEKTGGDRNIQLPKQSIKFEEVDAKTLQMTFTDKKYIEGYDWENKEHKIAHKNYNMQESSVCFEAWAVIIKTYCTEYKKIILAVDSVNGLYQNWIDKKNSRDAKNGHVGRFFYRALRFSEQYDWFELATEVETEVKAFEEEWINNKTKKLYNNIPHGEPNSSKDKNAINENYFEKQLSESEELYKKLTGIEALENNKIYRQLPVGLFENEVVAVNTVFTGGKSAIDMWTSYGNTIYPIELKYKQEMVGMITELFFYANFLWDLVGENGAFVLQVPKEKEQKLANMRGYDKLKKGSFANVKAVFLADKYHPLLTSEVIKTLNAITTEEKKVSVSYVQCIYEGDGKNIIKSISIKK